MPITELTLDPVTRVVRCETNKHVNNDARNDKPALVCLLSNTKNSAAIAQELDNAVAMSLEMGGEIDRRHNILNAYLTAHNLNTVDVTPDGNCFFRAAAYSLWGSEENFAMLREQVATWVEKTYNILGGLMPYSPDDGLHFHEHVKVLRFDGKAVGEDAIIDLTNIYKRSIYVYIASSEPVIYRPTDGCNATTSLPIRVAFFEPGHYRAVCRLTTIYVNISCHRFFV